MAVARHAAGARGELRALASQIHPVFMLPPLAAAWFGAVVAGGFDPGVGATHALAVFFAVYTAHVKDGYVDFYVRGEDDDHPLTRRGCVLAFTGATVGFVGCLLVLWVLVDPWAVLITVPGWVIGSCHAPQLDTNPVGVTLGYPAGVALAMVGGYYVQTTTVAPVVIGFAAVFLVTLTGVKIVDDEQDYEYDRSIDKRSVAVVLGRARARTLALGLLLLGPLGVLWGTVSGLFPSSSPVAALAFVSIVLVARHARPRLATMILIRGSYVFLALLLVAVWYRPLDPVGLPDITVLGPYTYLATELFFGTIALALLVHADAVAKAARTIVAVYPIAYVWDWYTLTVGVFEIPMRTGVDLFAIPIEEHLFMLVVPAFVIGVHETIEGLSAERSAVSSSSDAPPVE